LSQIRAPKQDFAERIGTSRSRLSTYMSGKGCTFSNVDGADAAGAVSDLVDALRCLYVSAGTTFTFRSDVLCVAGWGVAHEISSI